MSAINLFECNAFSVLFLVRGPINLHRGKAGDPPAEPSTLQQTDPPRNKQLTTGVSATDGVPRTAHQC
ncbi:hypothetical protein chiPu_0022652, partial [Chiloscyllium punctatum]|nr:hypothetical protein [Chiloscyllium punctatum]